MSTQASKAIVPRRSNNFGGKIDLTSSEVSLCNHIIKASREICDSIPLQKKGGKRKNWKSNINKIVNMMLLYKQCEMYIAHRNKYSQAIGIRDAVFNHFLNFQSSVGKEWSQLETAYLEKKKYLDENVDLKEINTIEKLINFILNAPVKAAKNNKNNKSKKNVLEKKTKTVAAKKNKTLTKAVEAKENKTSTSHAVTIDKIGNISITKVETTLLKKGTSGYNEFLKVAAKNFK